MEAPRNEGNMISKTRRTDAGVRAVLTALLLIVAAIPNSALRAGDPTETLTSLEQLAAARARGRQNSLYLQQQSVPVADAKPEIQLQRFAEHIGPLLQQYCVDCHGPDLTEGNIRIDTLDPDLLNGTDTDWWLEIFAVLGKGEMPPADEVQMPDSARSQIVGWLSQELQTASTLRRQQSGHSSFRRLTRYEYNYAMQDLLGLPFNFAADLPPEAATEDGFLNSSEMLHMSVSQLTVYRELARRALRQATVRGERPVELHWLGDMAAAAASGHQDQQQQLDKLRQEHAEDAEKLQQALQAAEEKFRNRPGGVFYSNQQTGWNTPARWNYHGAKYAIAPTEEPLAKTPPGVEVAVIPPGQRLTVELGNRIPEEGWMRVRVRAGRTTAERPGAATLDLDFGWQASNDSQAAVRVSPQPMVITASAVAPEWQEWLIPLSQIYPRNSFRTTAKMGELPNPSELIRLINTSVRAHEIHVEQVQITAPVWPEWPPESHRRIFSANAAGDEIQQAREILSKWMSAAWRRPVSDQELDRKLALFQRLKPFCDDFEETMTETLAVVLSAPEFLYLTTGQQSPQQDSKQLSQIDFASRLSTFLWCSLPDQQLLQAASAGTLQNRRQISAHINRMLQDPKAERFSQQFVEQWLGMQLLKFLKVDRDLHPRFGESLRESMQREPVLIFRELLQNNGSVIDLLHSDYVLADERLAHYYGLQEITGPEFRRIPLAADSERGGLLVQAGLLAMNSDGRDSHPLKRGIWLLKNLLNDPPPPPPPAVPEIDLADPEIAKLTLKQRIEQHRDQAACRSCHARIDPWGIAFEDYDAAGQRRTEAGGRPVDSQSTLFNGEPLNGILGLKLYLLEHRQDQFVRSMVDKLAAWGLGRPLTFADRSQLEQITARVRQQGDGLADLVTEIAVSDLFRSR